MVKCKFLFFVDIYFFLVFFRAYLYLVGFSSVYLFYFLFFWWKQCACFFYVISFFFFVEAYLDFNSIVYLSITYFASFVLSVSVSAFLFFLDLKLLIFRSPKSLSKGLCLLWISLTLLYFLSFQRKKGKRGERKRRRKGGGRVYDKGGVKGLRYRVFSEIRSSLFYLETFSSFSFSFVYLFGLSFL